MKNKIIDLFCGCGGMSRGFEMAGFEVALAIDFWKDAIETYKRNSPSVDARCMDIHRLDEKTMAESFNKNDVIGIIGGPPCQGFSTVGKRDVDDPRNQLYLQYCRIVETIRPQFFVIENVKGLMTLNGGAVKQDIIERFSAMGYNVSFKVINAANYGVPQNRQRVFFVGMRNAFFDFPQEFRYILSAKDGISDLPSASQWDGTSVIASYDKQPQNNFQRLMRGKTSRLSNHDFTVHSEQTVGIISRIPDGGSIRDLPPEFWKVRKYNKAFERMSSSRPANTVDTGHRNYFHYAEPRIPTVRENARLQSFPDDFVFLGTRGSQYKQVGNAVPPLLAKIIATAIKKQLKKTSSKGAGMKSVSISNLSSPGASFTEHTDDTMVSCFDYVSGMADASMPFMEFQDRLYREKKINKSNLRCILPMLRFAGLVSYGTNVIKASFFTELGTQYVTVAKLLNKIRSTEELSLNVEGLKKAQALKAKFLRYALAIIIKNDKCKYADGLRQVFRYLQRFDFIDKREFACLVYSIQSGAKDPVENVEPLILSCRSGKPINIKMIARNDAKGVIEEVGSLSWLTCYNYLLALIEQAGVVKSVKTGYQICRSSANELAELIEK